MLILSKDRDKVSSSKVIAKAKSIVVSMSFFGFDPTKPDSGRGSGRRQRDKKAEKPLDFEETYQGFGEHDQEEDDYLNDETFGNATELGTDFDFGYGKGSLESDVAPKSYADHGRSYASAAVAGPPSGQTGYGAAAVQGLDDGLDFKPMESLWTNQPMSMPMPQQFQQPQLPQHPQHPQQVLSMEQLERQQRQQQQQMAIPVQQQGFVGMPPQQDMKPMGYGYSPQGYMPQIHQMQGGGFPNQPQSFPPQAVPPQNMGTHQYQPMPLMFNRQMEPHQHPQQQVASPPSNQQQHLPVQQQLPQQSIPIGLSPQAQELGPQQQQQQSQQGSNFPVQMDSTRNSASPRSQALSPPHTPRDSNSRNGRRGSMRRQQEPLTEEEHKRLQIRQAKVDKILRHSGVMTPRDKDFITRYQLSQIVTDDPYNEDFYFQVYKIIQRGGVVGESNKGLIARAYLEHSGHRLGGRYKRADVALQRMQSQVEKAVTVAKERPQKNKENFDGAKEGVLGKISSTMNSKAPRRQLQIPTQKSEDDESNAAAIDEVVESLNGVELSSASKARRRSSYAFRTMDQSAVLCRSGGRKFVLSLIESVYSEVLELEAQLRSGKSIDNKALWDALHVADDSYEVSPFISILSFDKGVKIMPRILNFLDKAQKLRLLTLFFSELSHLNIIVTSSYKTNPHPTDVQLKKIELFQSVFLKIIVSFLSSSAEFLEVISLLLALIKDNNVSFISTSKIGLNLITVLISRAALIKQDINRGTVLSSSEISTWNEIYDKLFTALETRLALVFPPEEYTNRVVAISSSPSLSSANGEQTAKNHYYDHSYIWQFFASLALSGKLNHQRVIIDEIRDEIFGTISKAEELAKSTTVDEQVALYQRDKMYQDLNLFLNVMGLVARDGEITELK